MQTARPLRRLRRRRSIVDEPHFHSRDRFACLVAEKLSHITIKLNGMAATGGYALSDESCPAVCCSA